MKKSVKITLIVIAIIFAIALIVVGGILIFAPNKVALSTDDFKTKLEEKGYIVEDASYQLSDSDDIKEMYIATSENGEYKLEFYVFENLDYAKMFYKVNKKASEDFIDSSYSQSSISLKNYSKYSLSSSGKYKVISRVDNTVIYLNVINEYKDEVKELLKELGYW